MSAKIATRFYPIMDRFALTRTLVLIYPGEEWSAKQRLNRVAAAVAYVLGEGVQDFTMASTEQARHELARLTGHRPQGFQTETVGMLAICDDHDCVYAIVGVLRGREDECQWMTTAVRSAVERFDRKAMHVRVYEI